MWEEIQRRIRQLEEDEKRARIRKKMTKYIRPEDLAMYEEGDPSVAEFPRRGRPSKKTSLEIIEITDLPIEWYTMKRQLRKRGQSKRGSVYAVDPETSLLLSEYAAEEQAARGHEGRRGSEVDPETARLLRQFAAEDLLAARRHRKSSLDPETALLLQKYVPEDNQAPRPQHKRKTSQVSPETAKLLARFADEELKAKWNRRQSS
ncbi:uncharacterized protein [Anabrus simplex]|uniref:uncharacterized protein isoform X2 n=1 Tax=Anabrus simplex TaxID=316456 RepID=UPI0034DCE1E5